MPPWSNGCKTLGYGPGDPGSNPGGGVWAISSAEQSTWLLPTVSRVRILDGPLKEEKMSKLWLNIRIGFYHLQIGDPKWWSIRFRRNEHISLEEARPWFRICTFPFFR